MINDDENGVNTMISLDMTTNSDDLIAFKRAKCRAAFVVGFRVDY